MLSSPLRNRPVEEGKRCSPLGPVSYRGEVLGSSPVARPDSQRSRVLKVAGALAATACLICSNLARSDSSPAGQSQSSASQSPASIRQPPALKRTVDANAGSWGDVNVTHSTERPACNSVGANCAATVASGPRRCRSAPSSKHYWAGCISGRWYRPTSAWNTPIPVNPPIAPRSGSLISSFTNSWCVNAACLAPTMVSVPSVWVASSSTPLVTVQINYPTCNARRIRAPIPTGAVAAAPSDPEPSMAVLVSDTGVEWDFFKPTPPGAKPLSSGPICTATNNWAATLVARAKPGWTGSGTFRGAPRASGTLAGSGLIRPRDTERLAGSAWDHAVALSYRGTLAGKFVWPAISGDGTCTDSNACIPMGARLQLDPSIHCRKSAGLSGRWQRQLCRTLQTYGMIIVDSGSALLAQNPVSLRSYVYPWAPGWRHLPGALATHLRVIDWTKWTGRHKKPTGKRGSKLPDGAGG
jgi:hypothetical protein